MLIKNEIYSKRNIFKKAKPEKKLVCGPSFTAVVNRLEEAGAFEITEDRPVPLLHLGVTHRCLLRLKVVAALK